MRWMQASLGCTLALGVFAWSVGSALAQDAPAEPAQELPDTWYVTAVSAVGPRVQFTHYWSKRDRFRADTVIAGHRVVSIVNGDKYYSLDTVSALGLQVTRDPAAIAADKTRSRPFADEWDELMRAGGESIGTEMIQGRESEIFRLTNSTGRRTVWVSVTEPRVPVRVETFDRKSGKKESLEYINWLRGLNIADAFFEPPVQSQLEKLDYLEYARESRLGPVGAVPVLYRRFLQADFGD